MSIMTKTQQLSDTDLLAEFGITPCQVLLSKDQVSQYLASYQKRSSQTGYKPGPKSRKKAVRAETSADTCQSEEPKASTSCLEPSTSTSLTEKPSQLSTMKTENYSTRSRLRSRKRASSLGSELNKNVKTPKIATIPRTSRRLKKQAETFNSSDFREKTYKNVKEKIIKSKKVTKKIIINTEESDLSDSVNSSSMYIDEKVPTKFDSRPNSVTSNYSQQSLNYSLETIDDNIQSIANKLETYFNRRDIPDELSSVCITDDIGDEDIVGLEIGELMTDSSCNSVRSQSRASFIEIAIQPTVETSIVNKNESNSTESKKETTEIIKTSPVKQINIEKEDKKVFKFDDVNELVNFLSTCKTNPEKSTETLKVESTITSEQVKSQIKVKTIPEGNKCLKCGHNFVSKYLFKHHTCVVRADEDESTVSKLKLEDISSKPTTYMCKCCCWSFLFKETLVYHYKNAHGIDSSLIDKIVLECKFCTDHFLSKTSLQLHLTVEHFFNEELPIFDINSVIFKCKLCRKTFKTGSELLIHIKTHDENDQSNEEGEKHTSEVVSDIPTSSQKLPVKETKECDDESECNSNSTPESTNEEKSESDEQVLSFVSCPYCNICYESEIDLYFHGRNEHLSCVLCIKKFKDKIQLLRHEKEHNRGLIFFVKCNYCELDFKEGKELRTHCLDIHDKKIIPSVAIKVTKKVPESLTCFFCWSEFKNSADLHLHCRECHFMCSICCAMCSSKRHLNKHEKGHVLYICRDCSATFTESFELYQHCSRLHNKLIKPALCIAPKPTTEVEEDIPENTIPENCTPENLAPENSFTMDSIQMNTVPITSFPVNSGPYTSLPMNIVPINNFPMNNVPMTSFPINTNPINSIPINSVPVNAVPIPVTSFQMNSVSMMNQVNTISMNNTIPMSMMPMSNVTMNAMPVTSMDPINNVSLMSYPVNTSMNVMSMSPAVPEMTSFAMSSVPVTTVPMDTFTMSNIPMHSIPVNSYPISTIAMDSGPVTCVSMDTIPMCSTPVNGAPIINNNETTNTMDMNSIPMDNVSMNIDSTAIINNDNNFRDSVITDSNNMTYQNLCNVPIDIHSNVMYTNPIYTISSNSDSSDVQSTSPPYTFVCRYCDMTFETSLYLHEHITGIHDLFPCLNCQEYAELMENGCCCSCQSEDLAVIKEYK